MHDDRKQPWEPPPIPAEAFHQGDEWSNINRAPYDQVSGVIYKRAASIKRVAHAPLDPEPDAPPAVKGRGETVIRWLFSEQAGTEEGLLTGAAFAFLHDVTLAPEASTGMTARPEEQLLYVIEGRGQLQHQPDAGSPIVTRPLRPGDAALIHAGERHRLVNVLDANLRLLVLGLTRNV